ncbi:PorV/PorQ family protein [candidate division KSB1 bacterium]|nr:PorV/PorQ family protein [candidate division KSB1 bacterium]
MLKKLSLLSILIISFAPGLLMAQVELTTYAGRGKVGTTGLQFLKIGVSARAVAMGESYVALANDASAMYYNPAGLTQCKRREAFFTHTKWPADISHEFAGIILPTIRYGTIGAFLNVLTTGDMKRTVPYIGWTGEYFSCTDWAVGLSYSRALTDKFSIGGNVKYIVEYLDSEKISVYAADFGTLFDVGWRKMKFGMNISNFGPNSTFISEDFSLPINFKIGAVFEAFNRNHNNVMVSFEGCHPNDNVEQLALGVEYKFYDYVYLRSGYRMFVELDELDRVVRIGERDVDVDDPHEGLSMGVGFQIPFGNYITKLDYAYSDMGFLNDGQRFTIAFQF